MRKAIFLLLGSNLGDPADNLDKARLKISAGVGTIVKASSVYRSEPWGLTDQPFFLNQVVIAGTTADPFTILDTIAAIELALGRVRLVKWGARTIDIDILFYGDAIVHNDRLDIPHRGIPFRRFALEPLCEVAPDFIHPELQKSVAALLAECDDRSLVERL